MVRKKRHSGGASISLPSARETIITRTFDAPRALVFAAWTEPEQVKRWYGPRGTTLVSCVIDLRPGGTWRYVMRAADGTNHAFAGVYREIMAPARLVYTESYENRPAAEYLTTAVFDETQGRTKLTAKLLYKSQEHRDGHFQSGMEPAMQETLDRLSEHLASLS